MVDRKFECIKCGNCCSFHCRFKEGKLCRVHPSIIGEDVANRLRGFWCSDPPEFVIRWGYYCEPVVRKFTNETGIELTRDVQNGAVFIHEWDSDPKKIMALRKFLGIEDNH